MAIEQDAGEILSGVRLGETLGSPISIWVKNRDFANWKVAMSVEARPDADAEELRRVLLPRPGHADLVGVLKYDREDARDILERSSARETAARVAAGAVARCLLAEFGIEIGSHVTHLGGVDAAPVAGGDSAAAIGSRADESPLRCLDEEATAQMIAVIDAAAAAGDTLGGVFEVVVDGLPVGLGSHTSWAGRLDGRLAGALMSIQAMKGVEIGMGFGVASVQGSDVHDEIDLDPARRLTGGYRRRRNNAGGLEGGMTTGERLVARVAMKPLSSLARPLDSVDIETGEPTQAVRERSDVCAVPAAAIVGESMVSLVLADAMLEKFAGDSLTEMRRNHGSYLDHVNARNPGA
jgi:chorismate synthase